jgi:hypothetical protein
MFKNKKWDKPFSEKVSKRVKKIPTAQLSPWIENALYEVNRCMLEYDKSGDLFFLREALNGAEALHAVVNELHDRSVL